MLLEASRATAAAAEAAGEWNELLFSFSTQQVGWERTGDWSSIKSCPSNQTSIHPSIHGFVSSNCLPRHGVAFRLLLPSANYNDWYTISVLSVQFGSFLLFFLRDVVSSLPLAKSPLNLPARSEWVCTSPFGHSVVAIIIIVVLLLLLITRILWFL